MYDKYEKKQPDEERRPRGRPKVLFDVMTARFPQRTFEKIDKVRGTRERRADFVRKAVEQAIDERKPR